MTFLTSHPIPVGPFFETIIEWLKQYGGWFFAGLRTILTTCLELTVNLLLLPHPLLLIALIALLAAVIHRKWQIVLLVVCGFAYILNQGYWLDTMQTLSLLLWACVICMGIGIPLGIYGAHHPRGFQYIKPVLDLMQTLPTYVYLIPAIAFFRIGMVPGLIATIIFALPAPVRLTQIGIASTPKHLLEAGCAFGATKHQLLWKIELPHAIAQIRAAINQTIMLSLSMVVIAATVGSDGLGVKILRALQTNNIALGFQAGSVIVVLAIILDRLFRPGKAS